MHHTYDAIGRTLYMGNGHSRGAESLNQVIATVAGAGASGYSGDGGPATEADLFEPQGIAIGPDGSLYIADGGSNRVRRVSPSGIIATVAGSGVEGYSGDGGPATEAQLDYPVAVAVGSDGMLYIADNMNGRVRRVGPDGIITTIAGGGNPLDNVGDGGPATEALICSPYGLAVGQDGSVYIADHGCHRIRRVDPSGFIMTVAGDGTGKYGAECGDGGPATEAQIYGPANVAVGPDGSFYIAESYNRRVRRVSPDGIITTAAGNATRGYSGDGGPATEAQLNSTWDVAVGRDGALYIADSGNDCICRVRQDGIINTIAGTTVRGYGGDGGVATRAHLRYPTGVAAGPEGTLYIADKNNFRIRQVAPLLPSLSVENMVLTSEDGSEVFVFDNVGRHLHTVNALTGALLYEFSYDDEGLLTSIVDGDGNTTLIERDGDGNPTAIMGPYGQRTTLDLNSNGYLGRISNPAGEATSFAYTSEGLITEVTDPKGNTSAYGYDELGRLVRAEDPVGGVQTLARTDLSNGYEVAHTTALGRTTTYRVERLSTGGKRVLNTFGCCGENEVLIGTDGSTQTRYPDGTINLAEQGPDPRFGMQSPITESLTITTPGGLESTISMDRATVQADPDDPLSLTSQSDTIEINGRQYTRSYDGAANTVTSTAPLGREMVATFDAQGRFVEKQTPGLDPISYAYDTRGRLTAITQGSGDDTRSFSLSYDSDGRVADITDPLSQITSVEYDSAGRIIKHMLPGNREIRYSYDLNGNLTSITPPGRPSHSFTYTLVNLEEQYIPPDVGVGANATTYSYNLDRQLTSITRPDGAMVEFTYDSEGRPETIALPRGMVSDTYNPDTGDLSAVTAPDGNILSFTYDGSLLTEATWQGLVNGSVSRVYDNSFRVSSRSVNGGLTVDFSYDDDGLLAQAGSLALSRDAQNGAISGSTLASVTDARSYNGFGELEEYSAAYDDSDFFRAQYTRDKLGRITEMSETVDGHTDSCSYSYDSAGRLAYNGPDGLVSGT